MRPFLLPMLTRVKNSHTRAFHQFLVDRARTPFKWGANDCALFTADGILAQTAVDIAADFRGKYTDEAGAFATIQEVCGGSTVADAAAYCANQHGLTELQFPLMAQRGDLVVIENEGNVIAGLVHLNGREVVAMGPDGYVKLPITEVKRAWRTAGPTPVSGKRAGGMRLKKYRELLASEGKQS
jgi:hypothetical protein